MAEKLKPVTDKYAGQVDQALAAEMFAELEKIRASK